MKSPHYRPLNDAVKDGWERNPAGFLVVFPFIGIGYFLETFKYPILLPVFAVTTLGWSGGWVVKKIFDD